MASKIVLLSGRVAVGKTTLANRLKSRFGTVEVKTNELLIGRTPDIARERGAMQKLGEKIDRTTKGGWIAEHLTRLVTDLAEDALIVVDAVRIPAQIDAIRAAFGPQVVHIHLDANVEELTRRYELRKSESPKYREFPSYRELSGSKTELRVRFLARTADVVIKTDLATPDDVLVRAAARLGLYGRESNRLVDVLVGGAYGSEGKGNICSYLASEYDLLIRVGGPNAGHTVFGEPPYKHYQLPSGTRFSKAKLMIGPGAVLNVNKLLKEIADCEVTCERLAIDPRAVIIEEQDVKREQKTLVRSIGSTGQGVGVATARKIMRGASGKVRLARDVRELKPFIRESWVVLERAFRDNERIFLEGTQGTGLSVHHGEYPHVTSRETSVAGCLSDAGISPSRVRKVVMVCRTYPIRVEDPANATSGPMSREISWETISRRSHIPLPELERNERTTTTDRRRRVSEFDWALFRKAVSLNAPTDIALTFVDYITIRNRAARRFEQLSKETIHFIEELERVASAPVSLISTQFSDRCIIDRRAW